MKFSISDPLLRRRNFLEACAVGAGAVTSSFAATHHDWLRQVIDNAPLTMEFKGDTPPEALAWQRLFKKELDAHLGPYRPPEKWDSTLERRTEFADHIREERLLVAPGLDPVPFYLLLPRATAGEEGPRPGILAIHGHGSGHDWVVGREDTPEQKADVARFKDYGLQLVRRGYVVVAPCMAPFGRRKAAGLRATAACEATNLRLLMIGRLLMAENLRDLLWAVEYLARLPGVDPGRIGCVGLSLGGRMTMLTSAVEPRIKIAVISGALNCLQERSNLENGPGGCQMIPGLLKFGDTPEISGLIAPRPILWEVGSRDRLIKPDWAERALVRIRRVYRALGAEEAVAVDRFEGAHEWHGEVAYPLLARVLRP